ncbi:hypothetical protein [Desulfotruncus alcoholivorax]|uniref:hypothetical protein n=1 Tax=Desulfotruncus alcoholivorax TaxID=265477 RepID=UPI000420BC82|nr:hypothetical protein [Desulfotruncus alcoholivorax]
MKKEEVAKIVEGLSKEDQIWLLNEIICRFWPEFKGKPVGFYDLSKVIDDWDDKELDEYYQKKWDELQAGRHCNSQD